MALSASLSLDTSASLISASAELVDSGAFDRRPARTITSTFLDCEPPSNTAGGVTVHHTSYIVVFPAACSTREWLATYTVVESCPKKCGPRHVKDPHWIPPNFVVTTVTCNVCAAKTQTVTCPNALGTAQALVEGDGITATVQIDPTPPAAVPLGDSNTLPTAAETPGAVVDGFSDPGLLEPAPAPSLSAEGFSTDVVRPTGAANSLPSAAADITFLNNGAAVSGTRVLAGSPAGAVGQTPLATAGAPRAIGLKAGLALLTGIYMAILVL